METFTLALTQPIPLTGCLSQGVIPLTRLHGARNDGIEQLERTLGVPITTVDQQWRQWVKNDTLDLPMVEASFAVWGQDACQDEIALAGR